MAHDYNPGVNRSTRTLLIGALVLGVAATVIAIALRGQRAPTMWAQKDSSVLVFSPDGKTLATWGHGGYDLWDVATEKRRLRIETARDLDRGAIAFSPDGKLVAACTGEKLQWKLVDAETGAPVCDIEGEWVGTGAEFSRDGRWLLTSSGTWDVATGKVARRYEDARVVGFALEGHHVLVERGDAHREIDDLSPGAGPVRVLEDWHDTKTLTISPDGGSIASIVSGTVRVSDLATLTTKEVLPSGLLPHGLGWRGDGKVLAVAGVNGARVIDVATGKPVVSIEGAWQTATFSPRGGVVSLAAMQPRTLLIDATTGATVREIPGSGQVVWSSDGRTLAWMPLTAGSEDSSKAVRLIDVSGMPR